MTRRTRTFDCLSKLAGSLLLGERVPPSLILPEVGGKVSCLDAHDGTLGDDGVNAADALAAILAPGVSALSLPSGLP